MENERYSNDPITEALLEIRIVSSMKPETVALREALTGLSQDYSVKAELLNIQAQAVFGGQVGASAAQSPAGIVLHSNDEKRKFEARQDGFTFGQVAPYPGWASFKSEARRCWDAYRLYMQPQQITQLSLRYINRFQFPIADSIDEYLNVYPIGPKNFVEHQDRFFLQTQTTWPDMQAVAVVNQATVPPSSDEYYAMLLDIGVVRTAEIDSDDSRIWEILESFRELKNLVFETLITDGTRELLNRENI